MFSSDMLAVKVISIYTRRSPTHVKFNRTINTIYWNIWLLGNLVSTVHTVQNILTNRQKAVHKYCITNGNMNFIIISKTRLVAAFRICSPNTWRHYNCILSRVVQDSPHSLSSLTALRIPLLILLPTRIDRRFHNCSAYVCYKTAVILILWATLAFKFMRNCSWLKITLKILSYTSIHTNLEKLWNKSVLNSNINLNS